MDNPTTPQWSPFDPPTCPERSPKTGDQCVVGGEHEIHGADFTDHWRTPPAEEPTPGQLDRLWDMVQPEEGGEPQHTCGLCCESYLYVEDGVRMWFQSSRDWLDRPWWRKIQHPVLWIQVRERFCAMADVLDEMGK